MTCPECGRKVRAQLLTLALNQSITPHQFMALYEKTKDPETNTHLRLAPTCPTIEAAAAGVI